MLMNDLIKMRIFELLSEASQEVTNDELQNAYGELLEHIRCVSGYSKHFELLEMFTLTGRNQPTSEAD